MVVPLTLMVGFLDDGFGWRRFGSKTTVSVSV